MPVSYDRITTTIKREWLAQIIARAKKIEYRQIKPYWTKRFERVSVPFELRLLNGMNPPVPEVTVLIHKITKDRRAGDYKLQIKKVLSFRRGDKRRRKPKRRVLQMPPCLSRRIRGNERCRVANSSGKQSCRWRT